MDTNVKVEKTVASKVAAIVLLDKDTIKRDQDGIKSNLTALDQSIHNNAVQCLMHAEKHGDTSLMRRLLIDIISDKSGYRRQGLINWMRKHSPMELKSDTINLSGVDSNGEKRKFDIDAANATPFWLDADNNERVAKPVYQESLTGKARAGIREFRAAVANTKDGKPIDITKGFWDGKYTVEMMEFWDKVEQMLDALPVDDSKTVREAQKTIDKAVREPAK